MLKELAQLNAVSGFEESVTDYIAEKCKPYCTDIFTDNIGNLYAFKQGTAGDKTVALFAHTDEVGFLVHNITEHGVLKLLPVGGIDAGVLLGKRVKIGKNKVAGVIGSRAVHLLDAESRSRKIPMEALYIDIGAASKEEAEMLVQKGDPIYFDSPYFETEQYCFGKAFDDRAGCAVLLEIMKNSYAHNLWFVFTAQEETGTRGAKVASRRIEADCCLVVENTTCLDMPNVPSQKRSTHLKGGPAITIADGSAIADGNMRALLQAIDVPHQLKNVVAGGNDASAISMNGKKTAAVSIPCRYLHTAVGVIAKSDYRNTVQLLDSYLKGEQLC